MYRILYVDDEESNLRIFQISFKRQYEVFIAKSGMEGLQICEENQPIHLIIADQRMPGMTGVEFLEKVSQMYPNTVRIILTGFSDVESVIRAVNRCGIYRYMTKPWDREEMFLTVQNAIERYQLKEDNIDLIKSLQLANEDLEEKVQQRTSELELRNSKIQDSIRYARRIQKAFMIPESLIHNNLPDFFVFLKPLDIVSGDFYWYKKGENKTYIAAVDCTGHGIPGAFMSIIGHELLDRAFLKYGEKDLTSELILKELHSGIQEVLHQQETNNRDGMDISVCILDAQTNTCEYAGVKLPLLVIDGESLQVLNPNKAVLGDQRFNPEGEFYSHQIPLVDGMKFFMFSDGFPDQFGGHEKKKYGKKALISFLESNKNTDFSEMKTLLQEELSRWMKEGEENQIDDILVLGFTYHS